jgi:meiotically up-regulated gene 157 (Mug157) protein
MQRRSFLRQTGILATVGFLAPEVLKASPFDFPVVRVPASERKFSSKAIEKQISDMKARLKDPELAWLFGNCFPNTLDTTVDFEIRNGHPDTYVITGDIDAMWLRDSSAQVWPYLPFMKDDKNLQQLIAGVIRRQTQCILLDPYANAFYKDPGKISEWKDDLTEMKPGVHERKWEVDSLCYPIRLAWGYWEATGDTSVFDGDWKEAMRLVVTTFKEQQRLHDKGPYHFQRKTSWATDGVPLGGYGYPTKKIGLIHSMFRASDDATVYPFLIPDNFFAAQSLWQLGVLTRDGSAGPDKVLSQDASGLSRQLKSLLSEYGVAPHKKFGSVYAYEVNGMGSYNLMDDANVPGLLSLPFLMNFSDDPVYQNTRKYILSEEDPFFFKGKAAEGIGGPHVGMDYIWPMGIIMRAMTSADDAEIKQCIEWLKTTHAGTGFMHESFHKDDATKFTRKWFAWANTLFGELLLKVVKERPHLV